MSSVTVRKIAGDSVPSLHRAPQDLRLHFCVAECSMNGLMAFRLFTVFWPGFGD